MTIVFLAVRMLRID